MPNENPSRPVSPRRIAVLISGRGSNLQSIIDRVVSRHLDATIAVVISDRAGAAGLQRARDAGIEARCLGPDDHADRDAHDRAILDVLRDRRVDLVCLAGYKRLVGAPLLEAFPGWILNVHPSLLPAFPGVRAIEQALAYGVKVFGVTVHFVDGGMDTGPVSTPASTKWTVTPNTFTP